MRCESRNYRQSRGAFCETTLHIQRENANKHKTLSKTKKQLPIEFVDQCASRIVMQTMPTRTLCLKTNP